MLAPDHNLRLASLYGSLRKKLLDLTKRNRMLSYTLGARSRRSLQIFDAAPNSIYRALVDQGASLELKALDEPKDLPADEKSEDFIQALDHARNTDIAYLTQIRALESTGRDDEFAIAAAELELRLRVRTNLGMPPRATLKELNKNDYARSLNINPNAELPHNEADTGKRISGLQTLKFPDELESTLELVAADARLAEQEMGLSTLFLSFGFLEWYASDRRSAQCLHFDTIRRLRQYPNNGRDLRTGTNSCLLEGFWNGEILYSQWPVDTRTERKPATRIY
jgi:hypothetical protein